MARTYKRDSNGRFAGGGGGGSGGRPKARMATRGKNRLTRDNAGKITGTGDGATARGGRLRTASGKQRGAVVARIAGGSRLKGGKMRGQTAMTPRVNDAAKAAARIKRAETNLNRTRYDSIIANRIAGSAKSARAAKAARKADKSHMTAVTALSFLKGTQDAGASRRGSKYLAGNRERVSGSYSVGRVTNAFRTPRSRLVAPPKGVKTGRRIAGSGGQLRVVKPLRRR